MRYFRQLISLLMDNLEIGAFNTFANMVLQQIAIEPLITFYVSLPSTVPINMRPRLLKNVSRLEEMSFLISILIGSVRVTRIVPVSHSLILQAISLGTISYSGFLPIQAF